jgi:hypothetical protein
MEAETLPLIPLMTLICTDRKTAGGLRHTSFCAANICSEWAGTVSPSDEPLDGDGSWRKGCVSRGAKTQMFSGDGFVKMAGFQLFPRTISLLILGEDIS